MVDRDDGSDAHTQRTCSELMHVTKEGKKRGAKCFFFSQPSLQRSSGVDSTWQKKDINERGNIRYGAHLSSPSF